ncbi:MAG: hypothetical protein HYR70_14505 [Chloroflexi bacterium]|nr:hypothetical protein [Chloroflexota bacterium]MBI1855567.1 hypothetical protein [Chloroflexota bacterium]MBI3339844.1 hypothetical protein [Chloroflexota bacterium]
MTDPTESKTNFTGTYFDCDAVLRLANLARILSWVVLSVYILAALLSLFQFLPQYFSGLFYSKGMSTIDVLNLFSPYLTQPLPGIFYFVGLQAISSALLIFLDVEDNTRRAARK